MPESRTLHLNLNLIGPGAHPGAWRWPAADPWSFADIGHYVRLAQLAEGHLLDAVFVADTPALRPDIARHAQVQGFDPVALLCALALATQHIGLVATLSSSLSAPYDVARRMQSLDLISGGRAAWNVVVSGSDDAARNYGIETLADRQRKYERAEEFLDTVIELWRSWRPDAAPADKARGVFADVSLLAPIDHRGQFFDVRGPLTLPPSPQGYPVIFQAGASEPGLELAARTADVIFSSATDLRESRAFIAGMQRRAQRHGRPAGSVKVVPGLLTVVGSTEAEAVARHEALEELADRQAAVGRLAAVLEIEPGALRLDAPIPPGVIKDDLGSVRTSHGHYAAIAAAVNEGATLAEILRRVGTGGHRTVTGTPEQIVDHIATWFESGAADGFNLMPDVLADGAATLLDGVVPLLRKRGLFRTAYRERTLRERLGIAEVQW